MSPYVQIWLLSLVNKCPIGLRLPKLKASLVSPFHNQLVRVFWVILLLEHSILSMSIQFLSDNLRLCKKKFLE